MRPSMPPAPAARRARHSGHPPQATPVPPSDGVELVGGFEYNTAMHTLVLFLLTGCGDKDVAETGTPPVGDTDDTADTTDSDDTDDTADTDDSADTDDTADTSGATTWVDDVYPLYEARCADCHSYWGSTADVVYDTLQETMLSDPPMLTPGEPDNSLLLIKSKPEPPEGEQMPLQLSYLTLEEIERLRSWIADGAPESEFDSAIGNTYLSADYRCVMCHDWSEPSGEGLAEALYSLESGGLPFIDPGNPDGSLLYLKVADGEQPYGSRMPLSLPFFDDDQIEMIETWIADGARYE